MEDSKFIAAMSAFSALAIELMANGHVDMESLISRLHLAHQNLEEIGAQNASAALRDYLASAAPAWRIASTAGLRPS